MAWGKWISERVAPLVDLQGAYEREEGSCREFNSNISKDIVKFTFFVNNNNDGDFPICHLSLL